MQKKLTLAFLLLCCGVLLHAQNVEIDTLRIRSETYMKLCSPEKLYVHLDRSYYASGETIWFKGYLRNASPRSTAQTSNFIYTELLDSLGRVVIRAKIKRDGDGFPGHMLIGEDIKSGYYTFRAYTLWQLNNPIDYIFAQRLKILGENGRVKERQIEADSLHVDFYPEGGRYFACYKSVIAFKVMDNHGRSVEAMGSLVDDQNGDRIPVATRHDGMGAFSFIPKEGHTYSLETLDGGKFKLPDVSTDGGTVGVRMTEKEITINACAFSGRTCTLFARDAGAIVPLALFPGDGKVYSMRINLSIFSPGVNHLLVVDTPGHIIAERLFYVFDDKNFETSFKASVSGKAHGPISGSLEMKDENGSPLDANVSVAVVRGSFSHFLQDDNLVSFMGLSSELKGRINNPKHYFDSSLPIEKRAMDMNLLMMTQGWRYYDLEKIMNPTAGYYRIRFEREYAQTVEGTISRSIGKKMPEKFVFSVIIPKLHFHRFVNVDKADSFIIDSLDFPESTPFVINVDNKGLSYFIPKWSGEKFAPPYKHPLSPGVSNAEAVQQKVPLFSEVVQVDTLQAAVVTANYSDILGMGAFSRGVPQSDLITYGYQGLVEYLLMKYPVFEYNGEIMYNRNMRRFSVSTPDADEDSAPSAADDMAMETKGMVKLIDDGTESPWWSYESMLLEEIEAMSVSTHQDSYYNADGGVVAIKLRPGGKGAVKTRESLLYIVPLGYQKPAKFYNPRYDLGDPHDSYDHRNTILWDPSVSVRYGRATLNFCDTDMQDYPYIVNVQGYTKDGRPISFQCTIAD